MSGPASASFGPSASPSPATPKKKLATPEHTPTKTVARKKPVTVLAVEPKDAEEPPAKKPKTSKVKPVEPIAEQPEVEESAPKKAKKTKAAVVEAAAPAEPVPAAAPTTGGKVKKAVKKDVEGGAKPEKKAAENKGPKRALAAFMFYSNAARAQTRLDNPTLKITEIASLLGKQWADMTEEAKKPYVAMHDKDKLRYEAEKAAAAAGDSK